MGIIACVLCLIYFLLSLFFKKNRNTISPITIFFALWTFILFLSTLNLYNIYKPSDEAYILIMLMLTFFYLGNLLSMTIKKKYKIVFKKQIDDSNVIIEPKFKLFYILCFAIILFNIIDIIIIIKEAMAGIPMWKIRNWSLEPYGSSNPILDRRSFIEDAFRSIILAPFITIVYPIVAYYFFNSKSNKQKYKLLIISIILLISSSLAGGGGRLGFVYFFGCFLLAFIVMYKNKKIPQNIIKKYSKMLSLFLVLGIFTIFIFTNSRTGKGNFIKQAYTYFSLPPTLLSVWLPELKKAEYTYGMTTFFGLHSYVFRIFDTVGLDFLVPQIYNNAYTNILNAEIFKNVGYGVANAFVTPIYYFFVDGGYPFVCIASSFFGYIVSNIYEKLEKNINVKSFTIYALIMYGVFLTFIRVQTAVPTYIISFILVEFILKPSKKVKIEKDKAGDLDYEREC